MKKKIKHFLLKRRFKPLKNKRGFSLVEVLVAVSIIGIIGTIAYPQFQDYRKQASRTAGDTSIGNIERAFQNCIVLKEFDQCDSLADLGVKCAECTDSVDDPNNPTKFCAHIEKKIGGDDFRACVEFEGNDSKGKTYGGTLFDDILMCVDTWAGCTTTALNRNYVRRPFKECKVVGDCSGTTPSASCAGTSPTVTKACAAVPVNQAKCSAGVCSK